MRNPSFTVLSVALLLSLTGAVLGQEYLTKEGRLTQELKITQQQGGFVGFTGVQFTIAPDGSWTSVTLLNQKATPKSKGQLSTMELAKLGSLLAEFDLAKLPQKAGVATGANPHTIDFQYGKQKASFVGQVPPKLDKNSPTGSVESRFAGIWQGVSGLLKAKGKVKEDAKDR